MRADEHVERAGSVPMNFDKLTLDQYKYSLSLKSQNCNFFRFLNANLKN